MTCGKVTRWLGFSVIIRDGANLVLSESELGGWGSGREMSTQYTGSVQNY